jgi:hypothetical protein
MRAAWALLLIAAASQLVSGGNIVFVPDRISRSAEYIEFACPLESGVELKICWHASRNFCQNISLCAGCRTSVEINNRALTTSTRALDFMSSARSYFVWEAKSSSTRVFAAGRICVVSAATLHAPKDAALGSSVHVTVLDALMDTDAAEVERVSLSVICGDSRFLTECIEKSSDSCGVFVCRVTMPVCVGRRVRLLYVSSTSAAIEAVVNTSPSALLSVVPALTPDHFDTMFIKISVMFHGQSCPTEGVNVTVANQESHSALFLPQSFESPQTCLQVFQVCSSTFVDKSCQIFLRGSFIQFVFEGLLARLYSASSFPMQVSPVVMTDSSAPVPFNVQMFVPELHSISFTKCELTVDEALVGSLSLIKSITQIDVFKGNGSVCTNHDCAHAHPAFPLITSSQFDVRCMNGLKFPNGTFLVSRAYVRVIRPCPVLLSANSTSPASSHAGILVGGSVYVSIVDEVFCNSNASLNVLVLSSSFRVQLDFRVPFVSGNLCGKQLSFARESSFYVDSSADVTFLYCSGGTRVCSTAFLRLTGPASLSLSHSTLFSKSAQVVAFFLTDYSSSMNVSISLVVGNATKQELNLYETSEGSGTFEGSSLVCCNFDACPGLSIVGGYEVQFFYQSKVLPVALICLNATATVNTSNCLNSTFSPGSFSVSKFSLSVYNLFADSPFSISLQSPSVLAQSFIGVHVLCNNSVTLVPLYRSSSFRYDGTFGGIFALCPDTCLGAQINFTARVANEYITTTATIESAPSTSMLVDPSQMVVPGATVHVSIKRNDHLCLTCSDQLMLSVKSFSSAVVIPSPSLREGRVFISFRICGPQELQHEPVLECLHAAAGDTITLQFPGSDLLNLQMQLSPYLIVSETHVIPESCFYVFLSDFVPSMSLLLEASELQPQKSSFGKYFVKGCVSTERVLYIDRQFSLNSTFLSFVTFGLLLGGTQISSAKIQILSGDITVEIMNLPAISFLDRRSSLIVEVTIRNALLPRSNLSVFSTSGQLLTIPFLVNSSSVSVIPVVVDFECLMNTSKICALDGVSLIASVCAPSCVSSRPIQIYLAPEIYVRTRHPAGTSLRVFVLDSSVTSDHVHVNVSSDVSQIMYRLNKSSSSGLFEGSFPVLNLEQSLHQSLQHLTIGRAPYVLRIDYWNASKHVSVIKQSAASLTCSKEYEFSSSQQVFRIVLNHSGADDLEFVDIKVWSTFGAQMQDVRLFRTAEELFLGFFNSSFSTIAFPGPRLKATYSYEFDFQTQVAVCSISVDNSGSLSINPAAISRHHAFEILAINQTDVNASKAVIEACFLGSALPCMDMHLDVVSTGSFFAVFYASHVFPFISSGSFFSTFTVCFTFGQFRSCILIAENLEIEHPRLAIPEGIVTLLSRAFVPVSENMPKQLTCSFFASEGTRPIFNSSLLWNVTSLEFSSTFRFRDECGALCDTVRVFDAVCRYGLITSTFSMNFQASTLVRVRVPDSFAPRSKIRVTVIDADSNQDSSLIENAVVTVESDDVFLSESHELVETGPSTGVFSSDISSGSSTRLTVSFRSLNGQSVSATTSSSADIRADLTATHCNLDYDCFSPQPFHLPLITQFRICSFSLLNLALKVQCSPNSQLFIPISDNTTGTCWSVFVLTFPWYQIDAPNSLGSNQFACFAHESTLVVSSVVQTSHPSIPISSVVTYAIPESPVLFASPSILSSSSNVSLFLRNVRDFAPQVLRVISSDGSVYNLTMKRLPTSGDFSATFSPESALSPSTNPVLKFVWRDNYRKSDLECHVAVCSPAVLNSPSTLGYQGVANITIFTKQSALQIVLQVNNTATNQITTLPVVEKLTNKSGTLYEATLHISSSRNGLGSNGQSLLYALVGSILVVSFEDSCPFSVLQATIRVTESHVGTLQAPSAVLAGSNIPVTIDDSDLIPSMNSLVVNIRASSSIDVKFYQYPVLAQRSIIKIPTTTNTSLIKESSLVVNMSDTVLLVYEDVAPYDLLSVNVSVSPSCIANLSVGPLPIEINKNMSIRVMDCDAMATSVQIRISTFKGFCNVDLISSANTPGVFASSVVLKLGNNTNSGCASLSVTAGDLVTFQYVDDAPLAIMEQTHMARNESFSGLTIENNFLVLDEVSRVYVTLCINSDSIDPLFVQNTRALPSPIFSTADVSDVTEIKLVKVSDCMFVGSIHPVLEPIVPNRYDHNWLKFYSPPCENCVFANEGDTLRVWWPGSNSLESSFSIAQRAFFHAPTFAAAGSTFDIKVFDRDADLNVSVIDKVSVNVTFLDQNISYTLLETAFNSGVFHGTVFLSNFSSLGSIVFPFVSSSSRFVLLTYLDYNPSVIINTRVNITSNRIATLEIYPQTGFPGSSVVIQVLDVTRNQAPYILEKISVVVQGSSASPRTVQLFETSENSGMFAAEFVLSNGSTMYDVSNPFGVKALPGQKYSVHYINSAPYAVLTKNIVIAGPGKIIVNPIDPAKIVQVTLIDPDNSDFYSDSSSVRKIQNLIATSATGNFLAFTVQERDPGTGIFYGTFNVSSSLVFRSGVLVGVSLASRVIITYTDALPSMTITASIKVASIGSISLVSSTSGSAAADSEFVFKVVDFDRNLDSQMREVISVSVFSDPNSNFTVPCIESAIDSSEFLCRIFLATTTSVRPSLDSSVFIIPASRGQVLLLSYLDSIPNAAVLTASVTVANAGLLISNTSTIYVGGVFTVSLDNVYSNRNPVVKDSAILSVEHWFAGFLQSSIDFALPETLVSSALFTGVVATSPLVSPQSSTFASVVVPSVKPGSVLRVIFRQPELSLSLNVSVIVLSRPVLLVQAMLLNTDSFVEVSISSINLNATNALIPSLNVTVSQTSVSPKSTITMTLLSSLSDSGLFTGSLRLCSIPNCTSVLFAPEGSFVNFSYVDFYTGSEFFVSRRVSTRGRMQVPTSVFSQSTLSVRVLDPDADVSLAMDHLVVLASVVGYTQIVSITLTETDSKSGIFQGTLLVKDFSVPAVEGAINVPAKGTIQLVYEDAAPPAVVISAVAVSLLDQIVFETPIVIGEFFVINVTDSSAVEPRRELELLFWGGSTRVVLDLVVQGLYSGRAMISDDCSNRTFSSGCLAIYHGADVQVVYRGSSQLSVTIPASVMSNMIPSMKVCVSGQCTSSWSQLSSIVITNGAITTVLVVDFDFAAWHSLKQFVSVSCGSESDLVYLDAFRGSLPVAQFSASLTVFTNFEDYISSSSGSKLLCQPDSLVLFQIRDCALPKFVFASVRVVDAPPRLNLPPLFSIGDHLDLQLRDYFASTFQVSVMCTSNSDNEIISVSRTGVGDVFSGSVYVTAGQSRLNDGRLSVETVGERIDCTYISDATRLDARVSSVAKYCSQSFRFGYISPNLSNTLVLEALICDTLNEVHVSIQCSSGDREEILLFADSVNPSRFYGTINFTSNVDSYSEQDMIISLDSSAFIPCVATARLPSGNKTLSSSLYRPAEPELSASFDSTISIRACIWDSEAVSFGPNGNVVSFSLQHSSGSCSNHFSAIETAPHSGLFCRSNISVYEILNASPCKTSRMSDYIMVYNGAQLRIPIRTAINFLGTSSFAMVGSAVSVIAFVSTAVFSTSTLYSIVVFARYSSGIQEQITLNETGVSSASFSGSLYIPQVCSEVAWNQKGVQRCHYMQSTFVEIFLDHLQPPFRISLHMPPEFYISPIYPVVGLPVTASVVVPNISLPFVDAIVTSLSQSFALRLSCSDPSSLCTGVVPAEFFQSSPLLISLPLSYGVFNCTVVGNLAPAIKSNVSSDGAHVITVQDCDSVTNSSTMTATCNSTVETFSLVRNRCFFTAIVNISRLLVQSRCSSVIARYRNVATFTEKIIALYSPTLGVLYVTEITAAGTSVFVTVSDLDANVNPYEIDSISVTVCSSRSVEPCENIELRESTVDSGVFNGILATALDASVSAQDDGLLNVLPNNIVKINYFDDSFSRSISQSVRIVAPCSWLADSLPLKIVPGDTLVISVKDIDLNPAVRGNPPNAVRILIAGVWSSCTLLENAINSGVYVGQCNTTAWPVGSNVSIHYNCSESNLKLSASITVVPLPRVLVHPNPIIVGDSISILVFDAMATSSFVAVTLVRDSVYNVTSLMLPRANESTFAGNFSTKLINEILPCSFPITFLPTMQSLNVSYSVSNRPVVFSVATLKSKTSFYAEVSFPNLWIEILNPATVPFILNFGAISANISCSVLFAVSGWTTMRLVYSQSAQNLTCNSTVIVIPTFAQIGVKKFYIQYASSIQGILQRHVSVPNLPSFNVSSVSSTSESLIVSVSNISDSNGSNIFVRAQSFSPAGSIVGFDSAILQKQNDEVFIGKFKLSSSSSDGTLVLDLNGYIEFHVNGFTSSKFYLYASCSVSLFADFVNSSKRDVFIDVRTCSNHSINASVSALPAQSAIALNMSLVPSSGLQVLRRGFIPVSFSAQSAGFLYFATSANMQVTVVTAGETISKSFSLPAWNNLSCFSYSDASQITNAVALGRRLFVSSAPNSFFVDPIQIQFALGNDLEVVSASTQSNGDWMAYVHVDHSLHSVIGDGKITNISIGSTIIARIGHLSCSAEVYHRPSLFLTSNFNGSNWILKVWYVSSSLKSSQTEIAYVKQMNGSIFSVTMQSVAPRTFSGLFNTGCVPCSNISAWVNDYYEGNLSSTHQLPCVPRLSIFSASNRAAGYVFRGESLVIEVEFASAHYRDVRVSVEHDKNDSSVHVLLPCASFQLFCVTVVAIADGFVTVHFSIDGFRLSSSIQVVAKPVIRFYPAIIGQKTSELFVFVTDPLESNRSNVISIGVSISGCSLDRNISLNCSRENNIFVGRFRLFPSDVCFSLKIVSWYAQQSASSIVSSAIFASPNTEISTFTISPSSATVGDFVSISLTTLSSASQPSGFIVSVHGDPCGIDTESSFITLLPLFSGSNTFRTSLQIGSTAAVMGSCVLSEPGTYIFTVPGNYSGRDHAYMDITSAVSVVTVNATRVEMLHPAGITVMDPAAKSRSNVSVIIKVTGYDFALLLLQSGGAGTFVGTLRYEHIADFLDSGLPSAVCTIEYVSAVGIVAASNVTVGSSFVPDILSVGDVVSFSLSSPRLCFVPASRIQVIAIASSFSDRPTNISVVNKFTGTSCEISCWIKTSLYTQARPGYSELFDILLVLPNDALQVNVLLPWNESVVSLRSQASVNPFVSIVAPSYVTVGSALQVTLSGFGSYVVSVIAKNTAFQHAVFASVNNSSSSPLIIQTSNLAYVPFELYVRPGDLISIQARVDTLGLVLETQTAVAEVASIEIDPKNPVFGSVVQVRVFDADAPVASEATVSIVRHGTILHSSKYRVHLYKQTFRMLAAQLNLSKLIFARMTDSLIISYEDSAPLSVVSYNLAFWQSPLTSTVNFSGIKLTSSLSLKPSGQLQLNILSAGAYFNFAQRLSCNIYSLGSKSASHMDVENTMLFANSSGVLGGSMDLVSKELSSVSGKCANMMDGCLVVLSQLVVNITCGEAVSAIYSLGQLPVHGFFSDASKMFIIFTEFADTSVDVTSLHISSNNTDHTCQCPCTRQLGTPVISCSLCDSPLSRSFQARISPSVSLKLPSLIFQSEWLGTLGCYALVDSSLFCATKSAKFTNIALSQSSSSCGDCYVLRIASWNSSTSMFELNFPSSLLHLHLNSSSCLHVWLVLPSQVVFSSAVCFSPPEFSSSTPQQDSVFPLGLECSREVTVSVTSSAVCYRLQSETQTVRVIPIDSVSARISWQYSAALTLPVRLCVEAFVAPFGCNGPMGSGPKNLLSLRCWSLVMEPCVACASLGDNLVTISRRYSVDPVAVASIFFSTRANTLVSDGRGIETELPFGTPVRLGVVYEGSAGESLQVSKQFSKANMNALSALNHNLNSNASIEGKLVCLPVDLQNR